MTSAPRALRSPGAGPLDLDALVAALAGSFTVVTGAPRVVRVAGLDTFDRRLRSAGLRLEHHRSGAFERLVLTRADGGPDVVAPVTEPRWPALATALPPGPVREAVVPLADIRALMVGWDQRRRVRRVELHDRHDKTVARLEVHEALGGTSPAQSAPAEVRLLPLRGYEDAARRAGRLLAGLGLRPAADDASTAGGAATGSDQPVPASSAVDRSAPATALLALGLRGNLSAMQDNLPGLLDDVDTEFLHDFRVAVRRTRSTLKLGRPALPEVMRHRWEPAFKWLGDLTTPVRDLDVYELGLPTMAGWLVAAAPQDLEPFAAHLRRRRTAERRALVRGLRSARYTRLVADWGEALADLEVASRDGDPARRTAGQLADGSISRAFRRVARGGSAISADSPAEDLHDLRKRCKELRYALEVFAPVLDRSARKQAVSDLKVLQDVLGRFQDSQVQRSALREFAEEMTTGGTDSAAVLAMGELVGHLDAEQARARHDFDSTFGIFVRPAARRRMRLLAGAG